MTIQQAIEFLDHYKRWHTGEDIEMLPPKLLTAVMETIINYHKAKLN